MSPKRKSENAKSEAAGDALVPADPPETRSGLKLTQHDGDDLVVFSDEEMAAIALNAAPADDAREVVEALRAVIAEWDPRNHHVTADDMACAECGAACSIVMARAKLRAWDEATQKGARPTSGDYGHDATSATGGN